VALLPFFFPFYDRNVAVDRKIPEMLCSAAKLVVVAPDWAQHPPEWGYD